MKLARVDPPAVLLFSGGLDSYILYRLLAHRGGVPPYLLYCTIGHRYQGMELQCIRALQRSHASVGRALPVGYAGMCTVGRYERHEDGHIPLRNLLLCATAAIEVPDAQTIVLGAVAGESSRDKSQRFLSRTSRELSFQLHRTLHVIAPARHLTKSQLVSLYLGTFPGTVDRALVQMTRSCYGQTTYSVHTTGCGACMSCFRRWVAMTRNGVMEPYDADPAAWGAATLKSVGGRGLARILGEVPWREWVGLARNNFDAYRAVRARHHPLRIV
jgi:7-cyano-7-deazaguanine synthase in queuosine biosynthesis